jgi:hypothetical protein
VLSGGADGALLLWPLPPYDEAPEPGKPQERQE